MARALEEGDGVASGILLSKNISPERSHDWTEGAWNFVEGAPEWQPLLHRLLADTCVTDTWEEAKALQASRPEATVICRDGRMISAKGWQRRGKVRNSRPGRQECEAARELVLRLDQVTADATTLVGTVRNRIEKGREHLEASRSHERQIRQSLDEVRREHDRKEAQVRSLASETARRKDEATRLEQEILVHQKIAQEKNAEVARHLAAEQTLDQEMQGAEKCRQEAESAEVRLNDVLTDRRVERSAQQQRRDSCAAQLHPAEARRKELADLVLKRRDEISADTARMESARSESHSSAQAQQVASQRAKEIEASTSGLKQARENEVSLLTEKEGEVVRWRQEGEKAKDRLAELAVKSSQLDFQRQSLADRLQREYATPLMEAKSEGDGLPQTEEEWGKLEDEAKSLREKMDEMGPVNTEAISEYEELENRLKFLETEEKDLTTAKAQLEEAIRKINQTTRLLFEETFDKVRVNFGDTFWRVVWWRTSDRKNDGGGGCLGGGD